MRTSEILQRIEEGSSSERKVDLLKLDPSKANAASWETLLRDDARYMSEMKLALVHLVVDIEFVPKDGSKSNSFRASGSMVRLSSYLAEHSPRMSSISYTIIAVTRDRNISRKLGTEV